MNTIYSAVCTVALLSTAACGDQRQESSTNTSLHRGLSGEPSTLDPAMAADSFSQEVLDDLYEGLTRQMPDGKIVPAAASGWSVDASGTRYTFTIRSEARWSNGEPLRAADFVRAWRRVVDPANASPLADDLRLIAHASSIIHGESPVSDLGAVAAGDKQLVIRLESPAPYFPELLTRNAAYPMYSKVASGTGFKNAPVSNGAYTLLSWTPNQSIRLLKNVKYWDQENVSINDVEYIFVRDDNSQLARYRADQLEITDTVPSNAVAGLRQKHASELKIAPFLATSYYGFNLSAPPFRTNTKLRQAITMAIDRKRLVNSLGLGQPEAYAFVPSGTSNYTAYAWPWKALSDAQRISTARQLYADAGYSEKTPLHLRLLLNSNPAVKNTAIMISSMWKEVLGVDTVLIEEEYRVFLQSRHDKSRWDIVRLGWVADYDDASNFLDIFRTDSVNNDPGYKNSSFDDILDQAAALPDADKRRHLLEKGEEVMLKDYPIIPLYFFVSKRLVKPSVVGFAINLSNREPSKDLRYK